ncbi:MAG: FG-GAP repeat protein [Deltaproteobacteria bacterium]|nr:FG-GAP repeat protein [Deltaproteobacteria bacterium]
MRLPRLPSALWLFAAASLLPACDKELRTDEDGDGFALTVDCDDTNEARFPGAEERCDGVDDDCDGNIDESGVDGPGFWRDADGDGHGDGAFASTDCVAPLGYVDNDADCDDLDPLSGPGADERCDGEDNDCDGDIDEDAIDAPTWTGDKDGDGFGKSSSGQIVSCEAPEGYVDNADDCNDGEAELNPEAVWYSDIDEDGFGGEYTLVSCLPPSGYVDNNLDCDDLDAEVNLDAAEVCDGVDNDCDGLADDEDDSVSDRLTWYADVDGDGYGAGEGTTTCDPAEGAVSVEGDCDDGDAARSPGEFELCDDKIDNDCDGDADGGCPLVLNTGDVSFSGGASRDYFGYAVSAGGDANGDGYDDLLVGAYGADTSTTGAGAAYLFYGPFTDGDAYDVSDADVTVLGQSASDNLGYALGFAADVNGDGADEVILTAYGNNDGATDAGAVYLLLGGALPSSMGVASADLTVLGVSTSDTLGYYLADASGDLDGDGVVELVVGASGYDVPAIGAGGVFVFSADELGTTDADAAPWVFTGDASGSSQYVGYSAIVGRDLDGDGVGDAVIGAGGSGKTFVFSAPPEGSYTVSDADITLSGLKSSDSFGSALATGDLNGDGAPDVVVGARYDDSIATSAGAVYVFSGPFTTTKLTGADAVLKVSEETTYVYMGAPYQGLRAEDLNGDGADELLIGSYSRDQAWGSNAGAVGLFYGPASGVVVLGDADTLFAGDEASEAVGRDMDVGDLDGDGLQDLALGGPGANTEAGRVVLFLNTSL